MLVICVEIKPKPLEQRLLEQKPLANQHQISANQHQISQGFLVLFRFVFRVISCLRIRVFSWIGLTASRWSPRIAIHVGAWLSLVERTVRDREVGGSNPLAPTSLSLLHLYP